VLAQRQLLGRLFQHDMGLPEGLDCICALTPLQQASKRYCCTGNRCCRSGSCWSGCSSTTWGCRRLCNFSLTLKLRSAGLDAVVLHAEQVLAQRQLLERLFQHDMGLPEARLRRAVSYGGNPERLHRALHKLIRGDAITVATVGGSVTGACSGLAGENPMTMACK